MVKRAKAKDKLLAKLLDLEAEAMNLAESAIDLRLAYQDCLAQKAAKAAPVLRKDTYTRTWRAA